MSDDLVAMRLSVQPTARDGRYVPPINLREQHVSRSHANIAARLFEERARDGRRLDPEARRPRPHVHPSAVSFGWPWGPRPFA